MIEMEDEIRFVTKDGFKSAHDDAVDTLSMLSVMSAWRPSHKTSIKEKDSSGVWEDDRFKEESQISGLTSYVV
jgi:hypothetical protein